LLERPLRRSRRLSVTLRNVAKVRCRVDPGNEFISPELEQERIRRDVWWRQAIGS
jgi:hypothetical protein